MKKNKMQIYILLILLLTLIVSACNPNTELANVDEAGDTSFIEDEYGIKLYDDYVEFVDGRGESRSIKKNPKRVVVLFSSFIDIWTKNGGELVGMIKDDTKEISGIEGVEVIGKTGSISLEKVLALEPDLVILSSNSKAQRELIQPLVENDIPIIPLKYEYKDDYFRIAKIFAYINDRMDIYENETLKVKKDIEDILSRVPKAKENKILIMFSSSKAITARTSQSTLGEMLKDLNTVNIADNANNLLDDKNFSLEKIIEEDPDFIFVQTMGSNMEAVLERMKSDVESNPAWSTLSAVKNDRYVILPKDLYMYKANHRYAEAYRGLAEMLYPEVFKK